MISGRLVRRNRAYSALIVATMALGIGSLTAVWSVVDAVLLEPLPYRAPDRLISVQAVQPEKDRSNLATQVSTFAAFRQEVRRVNLSAMVGTTIQLETESGRQQQSAALTSPDFLRILGVPAALGPGFDASDGRRGGRRVGLLSDRLWRRSFGADQEIVGEVLPISGIDMLEDAAAGEELLTVVGVLPSDFKAPLKDLDPDIWIAVDFGALDPSKRQWAFVFGRLGEGITVAEAEAQMQAVYGRIQQETSAGSAWRIRLLSLREELVDEVRRPVLLLFLGGLLTLLIASGNTANLLLARSNARSAEVALRTALGAGQSRLFRQLLTEGLVPAVLAGIFGLGWAAVILRLIDARNLIGVPQRFEVEIDGSVLGAVLAVTLSTHLLFSLIPFFRYSKLRPGERLKDYAIASSRRSSGRGRFLLLSFQISLALIVAVTSGLLARSLTHLEDVDPGFRAPGLLSAKILLPKSSYPTGKERVVFYSRLLRHLENLPEVESVGAVNFLPFAGTRGATRFAVENPAEGVDGDAVVVDFRAVSPGYLATMEIPVVEGRLFSKGDETTPSMVVSARAARMLWGDRNPLGQRLKLGARDSQNPWVPVVGVVGDVKHRGLTAEEEPTIYVPFFYTTEMALVARARNEAALRGALRAETAATDSRVQPTDVQSMQQRIDADMGRIRLGARLMVFLTLLTILLVAVGVYGTIWHTVSECQREFCIRFSLGARPVDVSRLMVLKATPWIAGGLAVGLVGAVGLSHFISSLLYGVRPMEPVVFSSMVVAITVVAFTAVYMPTRRVSRIDPASALRA